MGKGTVGRELLAREPDLEWSVSATTRAPRPGEVDGVDYRFVTVEDFTRIRDSGGFLEWFDVYGQLKGTPREPVEAALAAGRDVLLEIDVQGALAVKQAFPEAVLVFLAAPSTAEQQRRLRAGAIPTIRARSPADSTRPAPSGGSPTGSTPWS